MAGRMLTRDDGAVTTFTWDGFDCIREQTGMSTTTYCIPEGVLTSFIRDGDRFDVHSDALGSIRMITDESGEVVARYDFDAWGGELAGNFDNVPGGFEYGFVGALGVRYDSATGLYYMRNRWCSITLQRFISRDPIGLKSGQNLYCYAKNNPTRFVDPYGLHDILITLPDGTRVPIAHDHGRNDPSVFDQSLTFQSDQFAKRNFFYEGDPRLKTVQGARRMRFLARDQGDRFDDTTTNCYFYAALSSGLFKRYGIDPRQHFILKWEGLQTMINAGLASGELEVSETNPQPNDLLLWRLNDNVYDSSRNRIATTNIDVEHTGVVASVSDSGEVTARSKSGIGPLHEGVTFRDKWREILIAIWRLSAGQVSGKRSAGRLRTVPIGR